jgi:methionine-rich copper-binding protein CopC
MHGTHARSAAALLTALLSALALFICTSHTALAHAEPVSSIPSPNQNLTGVPTSVTIVFSQHAKLAGSDISVYDRNGQVASIGPATVDKTDAKKMIVSMKGADHQVYLVVWHTVSADDGDSAVGAFEFGVNAKSGDLSETMTGSGNIGGGSIEGTPLFAVLIGVLGIVIGGAGGFAIARQQRIVQIFRKRAVRR